MRSLKLISAEETQFRLVKQLGQGGFAQAWLVKVLDEDLMREWEISENEFIVLKIPLSKKTGIALMKEISINGALQLGLSPKEVRYIVKYLGCAVYDQKIVMAMEYIPGGSLRNRIGMSNSWRPLKLADALDLAQGILRGLSVIHEHRIVHRDLKPENVLLDGKTPKIADFGVGKVVSETTLAKSMVGTPIYMSPEILLHNVASFNTDIWSFGVLWYEMIYGSLPYNLHRCQSIGKLIKCITDPKEKLQFPSDPNVPNQIKMIMAKSLEREPSKRYQSATELLSALRNALGIKTEVEKELEKLLPLPSQSEPSRLRWCVKRLEELRNRYPSSPQVYHHLGITLNKLKRYDEAIKTFEQGIEICESKNDKKKNIDWQQLTCNLFYGKIMACIALKNLNSALESLTALLERNCDPKLNRIARRLKKTLELQLARRSPAASAPIAESKASDDSDVSLLLQEQEIQKTQVEIEVERKLDDLLPLPPMSEPVKLRSAIKDLEQLLQQNPMIPRLYLHLGRGYNMLEHHGKALQIFDQGIKLLEKMNADKEMYLSDEITLLWELRYGKVLALMGKGDFKEAKKNLESALLLEVSSEIKRPGKIIYNNLLRLIGSK